MAELRLCEKLNQHIIADLWQLYCYDLHTYSNLANIYYQDGRYEPMAYFDNYWDESNRFPYVLYKNHEPVGFALVHDISVNPKADWKLAEFFIMAPFRREGLGQFLIEQLFQKHQGLWELSVLKDNVPALQFWEKNLLGSQKILHNEFQNYVFFEIHNI